MAELEKGKPVSLQELMVSTRIRELDAGIAQHKRNLCEGEAGLPIEEQLTMICGGLQKIKLAELAGTDCCRHAADSSPPRAIS